MITCDQLTAPTHQVLSPAKVGRKQCDETTCEDNYPTHHQTMVPAKEGKKQYDETTCEDNYSTHHQTMVPAKEGKKPSMSSHLSRTTGETSQTVTSGKNRPTGKSTPIKIMV